MAMLGAFVFLMFIIAPIAVVAIIVVASSKKNRDENPENFEKIIRTIYVYLLSIIFLFAIIGGVIYSVNSLIDYIIPESKVEERYIAQDSMAYPSIEPYYNDIDEDYINYYNQIQELQKEQEQKNERNKSLVGFYTGLSIIVISTPLFMYHYTLTKRLKEE